MSCERFQALLSPYLDGELAPTERAEVDAHLAACPECADLLARLRTALAAFASFPEVDLSEDLRRDMTFHFVTTIDEVLDLALTQPVPDATPASPPEGELQPSAAS